MQCSWQWSRYFYPRPPRGGRLHWHIGHKRTLQFLSTPSARRATRGPRKRTLQVPDFYPRPPRGGRLLHNDSRNFSTVFLSTPSARRATRHKPQEVLYDYYFYPRPPRGGRRFTGCPTRRGQKISIHALREEGDTTFTPRLAPERYFYPRPPRGGRPTGASANNAYELFLSTPSARRATIAFSIGATFS